MADLLRQVQEICRLMEIKPTRSKGQNFLIKEKIYEEIIQTADLKPTDTILEVGSGLGFLTIKLAQEVQKVVAVELDAGLASYLKMGLDSHNISKVQVVNENILQFNPAIYSLIAKKYKIVANLPYNITSIFLRRFLSSNFSPKFLVLMLQKEVAERITAKPPKMSLLAISVQYYAQAEIIRIVKADSFWPQPRVDSALIKLTLKDKKYSPIEDKFFFRIVKIGFIAKRKMLKNNLAVGLKIKPQIIENLLVSQGLNSRIRAESLALLDWQKLFAALRSFMV